MRFYRYEIQKDFFPREILSDSFPTRFPKFTRSFPRLVGWDIVCISLQRIYLYNSHSHVTIDAVVPSEYKRWLRPVSVPYEVDDLVTIINHSRHSRRAMITRHSPFMFPSPWWRPPVARWARTMSWIVHRLRTAAGRVKCTTAGGGGKPKTRTLLRLSCG